MDKIARVDTHRARRAAQSVAGASLLTEIAESFLKGGQTLRILTRGTQARNLTLCDNTLTGRERKTASHAIHLTETALDATVDLRIGERHRFDVLDIAFRVIIEYHTRVEQSLRVEELFHFLHDLKGLRAPLFLDKRRHVAACTVLGLERAVVLVDNQSLHLEHEILVLVDLGLRLKRLGKDEVIVAFQRIGIAVALQEFLQVGCRIGEVLNVESNVLNQHRSAQWTRTTHRRENSGTDSPVLGILGRVVGKLHRRIEVERLQNLLDGCDIGFQFFLRVALGLRQYGCQARSCRVVDR